MYFTGGLQGNCPEPPLEEREPPEDCLHFVTWKRSVGSASLGLSQFILLLGLFINMLNQSRIWRKGCTMNLSPGTEMLVGIIFFFLNSPFIQLAQHWWAPFLLLSTKLVNIMDPAHVFPCGLTPSPLQSTSHSTPSSVCLQLCQRLSKTAHTVESSLAHQQLL